MIEEIEVIIWCEDFPHATHKYFFDIGIDERQAKELAKQQSPCWTTCSLRKIYKFKLTTRII